MGSKLKIIFILAVFSISVLCSMAWGDEWTLTLQETDTGDTVVIVNGKIDAKINDYYGFDFEIYFGDQCQFIEGGTTCAWNYLPPIEIDKDNRSCTGATDQCEFSAFATGRSIRVELVLSNLSDWAFVSIYALGDPINPVPPLIESRQWALVLD